MIFLPTLTTANHGAQLHATDEDAVGLIYYLVICVCYLGARDQVEYCT